MIALAGVLQLIRPPNVFTAFADCLAGLLILHALGITVPAHAGLLVLASGCLYLSGIVLNDLADRDIDAKERPTRPIPSGAVSVVFAARLGLALMAAGLGIAAMIGRAPFTIALLLAACILLYDGGAKRTKLGPLVMGSCRGLDLALGLSAGLSLEQRWPTIAIAGPIVLALYVAGLTYIARDEVDGNTRRRARTGLTFLAILGAAVVALLIASPRLPATAWAWPWVALVLLLAWRNWAPVWRRHDGPSTGRAIGGGILLIPLVDAAICAVAGSPGWALVIAMFAIPAIILKQFFSPT